jgi:glycerate dehydrogenase
MEEAAKPVVCIVNAGRFNWDEQLDLSAIDGPCSVASDAADAPSDEQVLAQLAASESLYGSCDVVVTKEIPVSADLISRFPTSVRLLVEAGTGYNNVDMAAAKQRGLTVCSVPAYSR